MTRAQLITYVLGQFPDNNQQLIKPVNGRNALNALINNLFNLDDDDTDDVSEGVNLYYTDERVQDAVAIMLQPSFGGTLTWNYDDTTGTITPVLSISGSGGSEITNGTIISALSNIANWNDAFGNPNATVGGNWNATVPVGPSENDYYVEPAFTDGSVRHIVTFKKIATVLKPTRIPYIQ